MVTMVALILLAASSNRERAEIGLRQSDTVLMNVLYEATALHMGEHDSLTELLRTAEMASHLERVVLVATDGRVTSSTVDSEVGEPPLPELHTERQLAGGGHISVLRTESVLLVLAREASLESLLLGLALLAGTGVAGLLSGGLISRRLEKLSGGAEQAVCCRTFLRFDVSDRLRGGVGVQAVLRSKAVRRVGVQRLPSGFPGPHSLQAPHFPSVSLRSLRPLGH